MLINGVKRDYYDHLMGIGINREIVFSRYPKTTPVTNKDFLLYLKRHRKYDYFIRSYVRLIGFCELLRAKAPELLHSQKLTYNSLV
jgi:hypothetical protein